jgi:hypothetical protein
MHMLEPKLASQIQSLIQCIARRVMRSRQAFAAKVVDWFDFQARLAYILPLRETKKVIVGEYLLGLWRVGVNRACTEPCLEVVCSYPRSSVHRGDAFSKVVCEIIACGMPTFGIFYVFWQLLVSQYDDDIFEQAVDRIIRPTTTVLSQ